MLAFIPVIGPMLSVQLIAGWEVTKMALGIYLGVTNPITVIFGAGTYPWINLAVWALAF